MWIELCENNPELVHELLFRVFGIAGPAFDDVRIESANMSDCVPTEYEADSLVLHRADGAAVLAVIVEMQRRKDERKKGSWPVYAATTWARYGCEVVVLVLAPSNTIAQWAAEPIDLGPGSRVTPLAVGPELMPLITKPADAIAMPELAVLSALAHGAGPSGRDVLVALFASLCNLDDHRARIYSDYVQAALPEAARKHLEELMAVGTYEYRSDFARKHQAEARAEYVLKILSRREITVSEEARERILACRDPELADVWFDRAFEVATVDELFD
ncbi:hypothetical protein [Nonomuraea dietziae]